MVAPLLLKLEAAFRETEDLGLQGEISAQIASYKARVGEFQEVDQLRDRLRAHFSDGRYGRVSIRLMALDALVLYYRDLSPDARDRMLRASLIAGAFRQRDLQALTSSWLAHIDFNLNRFTEMAKWLAECFEHLDEDDGSAALRASLVLGDAYQFAGQSAIARLWYDQARTLASKLGDQAAFGALTYNKAALHVSTERLSALTEPMTPGSLALIDTEVRSAVNYQAVARLRSLDHLLTSATVGVQMLSGDAGAALQTIRTLLASNVVSSNSAAYAMLRADEVLCLARLGHADEVRVRAVAVEALPLESFTSDDRALIYAALATAYGALGEGERQSKLELNSESALSAHRATQAGLLELLQPYELGPKRD